MTQTLINHSPSLIFQPVQHFFVLSSLLLASIHPKLHTHTQHNVVGVFLVHECWMKPKKTAHSGGCPCCADLESSHRESLHTTDGNLGRLRANPPLLGGSQACTSSLYWATSPPTVIRNLCCAGKIRFGWFYLVHLWLMLDGICCKK